MITIGNLALGAIPRIAAVVDTMISTERLRNLKQVGVDLLELRIDLLEQGWGEIMAYIQVLRGRVQLPLIGTIRETESNRANRLSLFESIVPYIDAIDIELDTPIGPDVIAGAEGKTIIVSEHDFTCTPSVDGLNHMVERGIQQGADIVKIATMATCVQDITRLLRFTEDCTTPLVTIAMGPLGTASRVLAPLFGSLYTYGFITESVAPGQISAEVLTKEFELFYPQRNPS